MDAEAGVSVADAVAPAEVSNAAAGKRAAEGPAEGEPPSKQPTHTAAVETTTEPDAETNEEGKPAAWAHAEQTDEQEPGNEDKAAKPDSIFPLKLGPRTFESIEGCLAYFRRVLKSWPENVPLNEYEHLVLSDLLKTCHPRPRSKIGPGVVAFKVKTAFEHGSTCFFACHEGGTEVDFSYLKCLNNKAGYDIVQLRNSRDSKGRNSKPGGRGGFGGRGGGRNMRGRGGRRGRGRGRGRGGR